MTSFQTDQVCGSCGSRYDRRIEQTHEQVASKLAIISMVTIISAHPTTEERCVPDYLHKSLRLISTDDYHPKSPVYALESDGGRCPNCRDSLVEREEA